MTYPAPGVHPALSGRPGIDPPRPAGREAFSSQGINAYLDSAAGLALCAQYGSRAAAAAALAEGDRADLAWRRQQAEHLFDRYPSRYPSVADAMRDVGRPAGGAGAMLTGSSDDVVAAFKRIDPLSGARVLGDEEKDTQVVVLGTQRNDGTYTPADVRPPWARD